MTRFAVGIDLGTTHCAMAVAPLDDEAARPAIFDIPQLVARGQLEARPLLPSFLYFAHASEGAQALPWDAERTFVVGEAARARGADAPARVIASAKSWLSHPTVDRRAGILPPGAPDDVEKISPVEASWRYLEHLSEAFDARFGGGDAALSKQDVVVTVPASFDASARELTVEAALAAGIEKLTLLEEPQAALYAWVLALGDAWRKQVRPGDVILVVDVGGGTSDFSAIHAVDAGGSLGLERIAVGDHILLGGDNMDLALSHLVRQKVEAGGKTLDRAQQASLVHACRAAKERLLSDTAVDAVPVVVASRGSSLMGGTLRAELTRAEVTATLVEGFFPAVAADARPVTRARGGLTQLGLPYASDPAVTRHLASFLARQAGALGMPEGKRAARLLRPTAILFNGGVMKAEALRSRIVETLDAWLAADGAPPVRVLEGADLDLAVARGACAYALVRRGKGLRIRGGTARAYYVGIESAVPAVPGVEPPLTALCVAPFGMEEGTEARLPHELGVVVGEPVRFRFFGSTIRRADAAGAALEDWSSGELEELPPIEVTLPAEGRREGDVVPVRLRSAVTEVGTLELEAEPLRPLAAGERWRGELSVRGAGGPAEGEADRPKGHTRRDVPPKARRPARCGRNPDATLRRTLRNAAITGTGFYVPPRVVTNDDLVAMGLDTTHEWVVQRTGIESRRFADEGVGTSDLALPAARDAIERAGLRPRDLDLIVFATLSPDMAFPGSGVLLQQKLGLCDGADAKLCGALDVRNQCSGFLYGLHVATALVRSDAARHVLVVGAETHSAAIDLSTRGRSVSSLFGDGAGAVVVSGVDEDRGVRGTWVGADGRFAEALCQKVWDIKRRPFIPLSAHGTGHVEPSMMFAQMDGRTVFKHAVEKMCVALMQALWSTRTDPGQVDLFFFHQANMRINQFVAKQLNLPDEKVVHNIQRYGNTTAATIPILLAEAEREDACGAE